MGRRKYNGEKVFRLAEEGKDWNGNNTLGIQHIFPAGQIGLESDPELLGLVGHHDRGTSPTLQLS